MAQIATLAAEVRTTRGSRAAEKLRKAGKLPAVIYGHGEPVQSLSVNFDEFNRALRVLHARTFNLNIGGKTDTVLVKALQFDYLGDTITHVDFERHSLTERVKVTVPVELRNSPKAMAGGVLDQPLHVLHIECPFGSIPDAIRVDILNLTLGQPIHVRELTIPADVKVLDAAEAVVVQIKLPGAEPTADLLPGAESTGPEVIKKEKKVEDEE
jgi:large subunit ribosomal protein L25